MTRAEILALLAEIAAGKLDRTAAISEDTRLVEDLRLDSLALLTLAIEVENRFRLRLDDAGVAGVETVGELVDVIAAAASPEPAK
jgi:acyl carrier protein